MHVLLHSVPLTFQQATTDPHLHWRQIVLLFLKVQLSLLQEENCVLSHSVQLICSVVSIYLWPHEPQHARPPCPSPTPRVHPNPSLLCRWYDPTVSSSVVPFSSCPQSYPASGSFQMSQLSASGDQSIGVSASTSVPPMNTQDWSPLGWMDWLDLLVDQGTRKSLLQHHSSKASIFWCSAFFIVQLSHPHMTTGKNHSLD